MFRVTEILRESQVAWVSLTDLLFPEGSEFIELVPTTEVTGTL